MSFNADLESVARTAAHILALNHSEEAEKNLRASQIDLVGSGVRILDILFIVCVFRPAGRSAEANDYVEEGRGRKASETGLEARAEPRPEGGAGADRSETEGGGGGGEEELNRLNAAGVLVDREEDMPGLGTGGDDRRRPRL